MRFHPVIQALLGLALCTGMIRAGDDTPALLTAQGVIDKVEKDTLTLRPRGTDGKTGKQLVLRLTGTSRLYTLTTEKHAAGPILVQKHTEPGNLKPQQAVAVIYTGDTLPVLLSAVIQAGAAQAADGKGAWKLPRGVPAKVETALKYIDEHHSAREGYEGGRTFLNLGRAGEEKLPARDARGKPIKYQEWDVNPRVPGKNRGPERLVTGSDGSAYYTDDHYRTFKKVR